jgi:hypothetical protein
VPLLDDASWSLFIFFNQDDIFMVLALALVLWEEVGGSVTRTTLAHASL